MKRRTIGDQPVASLNIAVIIGSESNAIHEMADFLIPIYCSPIKKHWLMWRWSAAATTRHRSMRCTALCARCSVHGAPWHSAGQERTDTSAPHGQSPFAPSQAAVAQTDVGHCRLSLQDCTRKNCCGFIQLLN